MFPINIKLNVNWLIYHKNIIKYIVHNKPNKFPMGFIILFLLVSLIILGLAIAIIKYIKGGKARTFYPSNASKDKPPLNTVNNIESFEMASAIEIQGNINANNGYIQRLRSLSGNEAEGDINETISNNESVQDVSHNEIKGQSGTATINGEDIVHANEENDHDEENANNDIENMTAGDRSMKYQVNAVKQISYYIDNSDK